MDSFKFRWIGMAPDGESVVLQRYHGEFVAPDFAEPQWFDKHPDEWRIGAALDVETTGRSAQTDHIIEIGIRPFRFHRQTGQVLYWEPGYGALEDPGIPLPEEIIRVTGITDEMVRGQAIDWPQVERLIADAQIILAHNASFDRPFVDNRVAASREKIWGCSFQQVDWAAKGFPSQKLEVLSIYHGFFVNAHRALADADALLHLLNMPDPLTQTPYLGEVLANARKRMSWVFAFGSPIHTKDLLKARGYRWDAENRVWNKPLLAEQADAEVSWLTDQVYSGDFRGVVRPLGLQDTFKAAPVGASPRQNGAQISI